MADGPSGGPGGEAPGPEPARLDDLLESISDAFYALDGAWRFVVFNRAAEEFFGVSRADVLGRSLWDVFPEGRGTDYEAACNRAMHEGAVQRFETTSTLRPGHMVELRVGPLRAGGVTVALTDITERVRAQERLLEIGRRQMALDTERAAILVQLAEGVIVTDAEGRIVFVNEAAERLHGAKRLDVTPDDYTQAYRLLTDDGRPYPPEDLPLTRAVRDGLSIVDATWRIRRPDGTEVLAIGSARPIRDAEGRQTGAVLTVRDDTSRRAAEAALRESEANYRYAAELNPQVAWSALPDGQLDRVAARWRDWTGSSGLGSTYADVLHPDDVQRTLDVWGRSVATGEPYDILHRVRRTSGEYRWIRSRAYPRRDERGQIVRWYGATEDVHEQKLAEEHLKLMVLELNHRVKNNLATVQAIAVQTLRGTESPAEAREAFLRRITALAAAHDILTREQWEGVGVAEIAEGVLHALQGTEGRVLLAGPSLRLPPKAALSLSMAFHKLGTNALKYGALSTPEGQVRLDWRLAGSAPAVLELSWSEHGGPPVVRPTSRGFGSRLLERGLAAEFGGEVRMIFDPAGLMCRISMPLQAA